MKSIKLEEFMKMLEEDKGNDGEAFIKKVLDKAEEVKAKEDSPTNGMPGQDMGAGGDMGGGMPQGGGY